jgi:protein-disulfide isomerase
MRTPLFFSGLLAAALCLAAAEPDGAVRSNPASNILVEINGTKITLADFERKHPTALFQAQNSYYEAQRKAIESFVDQYLMEEQAKKENITVSELLERHIISKIAKEPSEEALRVFYEGVDTNEPFEAVRSRIVEGLRQRRALKLRTAYLESLRSQAKIKVQLAPPRAAISLKDTAVKGPARALVTLVEYADYECPYCQQIVPVVAKLRSEFKDQLAYAFKDLPLPMHANAQKAAEASRCAESQGKYWEYHDLLFVRKQFEADGLKGLARELKLDGEKFDKCLDSGEKAEAVRLHASEAQSLGLQGTPSFFVNGRAVNGAVSYESLRALIEEELRAASLQSPQTASR